MDPNCKSFGNKLPFACTHIFILVIIKARHEANSIITQKGPGAKLIKIKGRENEVLSTFFFIVTGTSCVTNDFLRRLGCDSFLMPYDRTAVSLEAVL